MIKKQKLLDASRKKTLAQRGKLLEELSSIDFFIKGSLVQSEKKCGRKGCKCENGQLHPHWIISIFRDGKTSVLYVSKSMREKAEEAISAYQRAKKIMDTISDINVKLLKDQS